MKRCLLIFVLLGCTAWAATDKAHQGPSKADLKLASQSFLHGWQLQKDGHLKEAFEEFSKAASLAPANRQYATARELIRTRLTADYVERGNLLVRGGDDKRARDEFKNALAVDPQNGYAQERLHEVTPDDPERDHVLQLLASVEDVEAKPKPGKANFHVHGDMRELYEAIGRSFGITITYDSSITSHRVRFDVDDIDFYSAMRLAGSATHTFWAPISTKQVVVATDTQEMRRQYERTSLQTFYVSNAQTQTELNDVANVLRNIFEVKLVSVVADKNVITVRAPKEQMKIISAMLDDAIKGRPEVVFDIRAYELDYNKLLQYGLGLQNTFTIFNVYAAIYAALGPNAQSVINQLQQTGTINPSSIPIGSLASLQSSPLLSPFLFFGKGWGLTAFNVSPVTAQLSSNQSYSSDLEHVTLRAANGEAATMTIGTRFPISLGSFTNVSITTTGQPQLGTAFPQVQYEDLGLVFKTTPHVQADDHVNLELHLQIKGLGAQQFNGIPVITNRDYAGSITVKDGEPSVVAGIIEDELDRSTSGYPAAGQLPALNTILNTNSKQHTKTEVLIMITPHIVRKPEHKLENVVWDANP